MSEDWRGRSEAVLKTMQQRAGEHLLRNREALAEIQPEAEKGRGANVLGKIWNAPNTALGLAYGGVGHVIGELNRLRPGAQPDPRIQLGHNAVEFVQNPLGGIGAITIGNTTTYSGDPYDPSDAAWYPDGRAPSTAENGHSYQAHEEQHTRQGEQLGPFYLPSNAAGGM